MASIVRTNPLSDERFDIDAGVVTSEDGSGFDQWLKETVQRTKKDWTSTRGWRMDQAHFLQRRYTLLFRNPDKPWRNSSNIVPPLMDKEITQLLPAYHNLRHGSDRTVKAKARSIADAKKEADFELWQNSLYEGHAGRYSMPDYHLQCALHDSAMLQYGVAGWHVEYSKRTRIVPRHITARNIGGLLGKLVVIPDLTEEQRAQAQQATAQTGRLSVNMNDEQVLAAFGEPVNPMNRAVFDRHAKKIRELVIKQFELDDTIAVERKAADKIVSWLGSGDPDDKGVVIRTTTIIEDCPRARFLHPIDLIVPRAAPFDVQRCPRLAVRHWWTEEEFWGRARDDKLENAEEAWDSARSRTFFSSDNEVKRTEELLRLENRGLGPKTDDAVEREFWEIFTTADLTDTRSPERLRLIVEPQSMTKLLAQSNPYRHGRWPVTLSSFELVQKSMHALRGVPKVINDSDLHMTAAHRAKLNSWLIQTGRMFVVKENSRADRNGLRYSPTMVVRTGNITNDIREIQPNTAGIVWEREVQWHQMWVQAHLGTIAHDITADAKLENPRTATEMNIRSSDNRRLMSMRGDLFLEQQAVMHEQVADLSLQYAPERFLVHVTAEGPREMLRENVLGLYSVRPATAAGDMDPEYRAQKAMARAQFLMNSAPIINSSPTHVADVVGAFKEALDADDPGASKRLMPERPSEEAMASLMQKLEAAREAVQNGELANAARTDFANLTQDQIIKLYKLAVARMPHKELAVIEQEGQAAASEIDTDMALAASRGGA